MVPKSIRWRIQLWHGTLLTLLVAALMAGFYTYEARTRLQAVDTELQEFLTSILPVITPPGGPPQFGQRPPLRRGGFGPRGEATDEIQAQLASGLYYAAWTREGRTITQSKNVPSDLARPDPEEEADSNHATRGTWRELIHRSPGGGIVVAGTSIAPLQTELRRLAFWLVGAGVFVVGAGITVGWWLAGRAIRPIAEISTTARKIAGGDLSERINVEETESELGALAGTLNETFHRLETNFAQQVRFTADASHELRTPLAVMLAETQRVLRRDRTPEEYRQALEVCGRSGERMRTLVDSLLDLARLDSGEFSISPEECDLARIARESIEFIRPLAREHNVVIHETIEGISGRADATKLGQVLNNLLSNAIVHNRDGIVVTLTLDQRNGEATFTVADNGAGIPADALPHLFERFYRVDKSRARSQGGSGLGLSISQAIVEAHGGSVEVESVIGKGTKFTVRLPLK